MFKINYFRAADNWKSIVKTVKKSWEKEDWFCFQALFQYVQTHCNSYPES